MYNMIEEGEPADLDTLDRYLYFDDPDEGLMQGEEVPEIDEIMDDIDVETMNNQDFSKLLSNYNLSPSIKQAYETKFHKAKRIYKREKAKTRVTTPCLKLLQPLQV